MKYLRTLAAVGLWVMAGTAQAQTQCGLRDEVSMLAQLDGFWDIIGAVAIDTPDESWVDPWEARMRIMRSGQVILYWNGERGDTVTLRTDDDGLDEGDLAKAFERTGADWVAEEFIHSPCGPDGLVQYRQTFDDPNGDYNDVTVLPYYADKMLFILEVETVGEQGLTFFTMVGVMTPVE